jgi:membrane-associated phospholipid phosphatase
MIAVPIYALFPVAPPRLAGIGIIDTISDKSETSLNSHVATSFYNPFAAVPSLHVGFAFAVGIALAVAARRWWSRTLALLWGPTVALALVATGNHFLFDIAAGLSSQRRGSWSGEPRPAIVTSARRRVSNE